MARVCIDSTLLSPIVRDRPNAMALVRGWEAQGDVLLTTELNRYEVLLGILTEKPPARSESYRQRLEALLSGMDVLPVTRDALDTAAQRQAELYAKGRPASVMDLLIAAVAQVGGCDEIATNNVEDFRRIDLLPLRAC